MVRLGVYLWLRRQWVSALGIVDMSQPSHLPPFPVTNIILQKKKPFSSDQYHFAKKNTPFSSDQYHFAKKYPLFQWPISSLTILKKKIPRESFSFENVFCLVIMQQAWFRSMWVRFRWDGEKRCNGQHCPGQLTFHLNLLTDESFLFPRLSCHCLDNV